MMLPVDMVIDDEDCFDCDEDVLDEVFFEHHGSLSSHQPIGCSPYLTPKPMRKSCGRVRGIGRNRQVEFLGFSCRKSASAFVRVSAPLQRAFYFTSNFPMSPMLRHLGFQLNKRLSFNRTVPYMWTVVYILRPSFLEQDVFAAFLSEEG